MIWTHPDETNHVLLALTKLEAVGLCSRLTAAQTLPDCALLSSDRLLRPRSCHSMPTRQGSTMSAQGSINPERRRQNWAVKLFLCPTLILWYCAFLRAQDCSSPKTPQFEIVTMTGEAQAKSSEDAKDAIEVEHRFADELAQKLVDSHVCVFGRDNNVPASRTNIRFEVKAVASLDPHTPNIAAVAVNVYVVDRPPKFESFPIALVPILIENERDFEIGARVVMYEWDRAKLLTARTKNKEQ